MTSPPVVGTPLPEAERPRRRSLWDLVRRRRRRVPARRRSPRLRWGRLLLAALLPLALVAAAVGFWKARGPASPFEGLAPAGAPLAVEGEVGAVLDLLHRHPPLGPRVLREFGLTGALAAEPDSRILVAVLPGSTGEEEACRRDLATLAVALDEAWEDGEAYPSALTAPGPCPLGGRRTYRADGSDFEVECRGPGHQVRYTSTGGFADSGDRSAADRPVMVAMAEGARPRPVRPGLASRGARGMRVLCSERSALDAALSGPREVRSPLPGPADAPVRVRMVGAVAARVVPPVLAGLLQGTGEVRLWGDPARGRWSLRAADPSAEAPVSAPDVAGALGDLPPAAVALAADPGFLGQLWPAGGAALAAGHRARPQVIALASSRPLEGADWEPGLARLLAGRSPAVLTAACSSGARAREWLAGTALGPSLQWSGDRLRGPGVEADLDGGSLVVRLAAEGWAEAPRPRIPASSAEALAAGWVTFEEGSGARGVWAWSAGRCDGFRWLEVERSGAPAPEGRAAGPEPPLIRSR